MSRPELFADLTFDGARARATAEGKLLLVDATASWCQPCQHMDRTTWRDAELAAWLAERAVCVQVDVDATPAVAQMLGIQAMPTVVVLNDGKELDRITGARPANALKAWLEGVLRGETELSAMQKQADAGDMGARYELAVTLARTGKLDEATEALAWLWEHVLEHEPAMVGVRLSYMASEIAQLAGTHPPAHARFSAIRDALDTNDASKVADWIALNRILGQSDKTLAWFDRVGLAMARANPTLAARLEQDLMEPLVKARRWKDLGQLYVDPVKLAQSQRQTVKQVAGRAAPPELMGRMAEVTEALTANLRQRLAIMHTALVAAGRIADADALRADITASDDAAATLRALDVLAARA